MYRILNHPSSECHSDCKLQVVLVFKIKKLSLFYISSLNSWGWKVSACTLLSNYFSIYSFYLIIDCSFFTKLIISPSAYLISRHFCYRPTYSRSCMRSLIHLWSHPSKKYTGHAAFVTYIRQAHLMIRESSLLLPHPPFYAIFERHLLPLFRI